MVIISENPTIEEFKILRKSVGWPIPTDIEIKAGIDNSAYFVIAKDNIKTIAMCRLVGDSSFMFLIADMIVLPEYQGQGIGKQLMLNVKDHLKNNYSSKSAISLMSAKGKEGFYEKLGFISRPTELFGNGMMLQL